MWGYGSARLALRALTTRRLDRRDAALEELDVEPSSSRWAALRQRYDLGEELGSGGGGRVFSGRCKARRHRRIRPAEVKAAA